MNGKGRKPRARTRIESRRDSATTNKNEKDDFSKLLTSGAGLQIANLAYLGRELPLFCVISIFVRDSSSLARKSEISEIS